MVIPYRISLSSNQTLQAHSLDSQEGCLEKGTCELGIKKMSWTLPGKEVSGRDTACAKAS